MTGHTRLQNDAQNFIPNFYFIYAFQQQHSPNATATPDLAGLVTPDQAVLNTLAQAVVLTQVLVVLVTLDLEVLVMPALVAALTLAQAAKVAAPFLLWKVISISNALLF